MINYSGGRRFRQFFGTEVWVGGFVGSHIVDHCEGAAGRQDPEPFGDELWDVRKVMRSDAAGHEVEAVIIER